MMTRHRRRQAARRPDPVDRLLDQVEGSLSVRRRRSESFGLGDVLVAPVVELPIAIWIGTRRPLWRESPQEIGIRMAPSPLVGEGYAGLARRSRA